MKRFFMSVVAVAIVGLSAGEQAWAKGPVGTSGQGGFTKGGFTPGGGAQGNLGGIGHGIPPVGQSINPKFVKPDLVKPNLVKPEIVKPDLIKPDLIKPNFVKPDL